MPRKSDQNTGVGQRSMLGRHEEAEQGRCSSAYTSQSEACTPCVFHACANQILPQTNKAKTSNTMHYSNLMPYFQCLVHNLSPLLHMPNHPSSGQCSSVSMECMVPPPHPNVPHTLLRGCCAQGSACVYLHRVPTEDDEKYHSKHMGADIFGREKRGESEGFTKVWPLGLSYIRSDDRITSRDTRITSRDTSTLGLVPGSSTGCWDTGT